MSFTIFVENMSTIESPFCNILPISSFYFILRTEIHELPMYIFPETNFDFSFPSKTKLVQITEYLKSAINSMKCIEVDVVNS